MLKYALLISLVLPIVPAFAQDDTGCEQLSDGVWACPLPMKPAAPPTCHVYSDQLLCTGPVVVPALPEKKKPTNCGWNKSGRYVCW